MAEPERKCATCKFYEPAPIWRKGWCRNPLLYAPQQSHLVAEDDLDCSRGLSDYWEAADGTGPNAGVNIAASGDGRDLFGRGTAGSGASGVGAADNSWMLARNTPESEAGGYSGSGSGAFNPSGYSSVGRTVPPPDDDGYAPQESAGSRPASQPRYLGSVGDVDEPGDVRNPWDNSQSGYAAPPVGGEAAPYGQGGHEGNSGYGAVDPEADNRGYGQAGAYGGGGAAAGYSAAGGYGQAPNGDGIADPGGYGQGGYGQNGYEQGGYGAPEGSYGQGSYGAEQGGYGQGGYGAPQGGYGQGGYEQGGYGTPSGPPPSVSGTKSPAAGGRGQRVTAAPEGGARSLSYYTEERYWTDYAKLAVPVVVVLALLGAIWFIGTGRINGKGNATGTPNATTLAAGGGTAGAGTRAAGSLGTTAASITAGTPPRPGITTVPGGMGTPAASQPTLPIAVPGGMPSPAPMTGSPPVVPPPAMPVTMMKYKAKAGTGGVNMRAMPSASATLVATIPEGTEVVQAGEQKMATDGTTWFNVTSGDKTGWIRSDLLDPVTG